MHLLPPPPLKPAFPAARLPRPHLCTVSSLSAISVALAVLLSTICASSSTTRHQRSRVRGVGTTSYLRGPGGEQGVGKAIGKQVYVILTPHLADTGRDAANANVSATETRRIRLLVRCSQVGYRLASVS